LLGVRPGSTATSISPSMSPSWCSNTCCRRTAGMVTGWRRTGDRVALHSLRAAHARSMSIQSSSTRRAPVGNVEGQEPFRYPEDAFAQGLIDGRVVGLPVCVAAIAIPPWLCAARTRQSRHRPARRPDRTCQHHLNVRLEAPRRSADSRWAKETSRMTRVKSTEPQQPPATIALLCSPQSETAAAPGAAVGSASAPLLSSRLAAAATAIVSTPR
jgi:hypothetical protein